MKVNDSSTTLSAKQEKLIMLLCSGVAIVTAAKNINIGEATAHRWLKLPHFQTAYKQAQARLFEQAMSSLLLKVDTAIACLSRHMTDVETPPATQVRSAQLILEQLREHFQAQQLDARLTLLEDALKDSER